MKRKDSRYRTMSASTRLVRPAEHHADFDLPSTSELPGFHGKRIFVIRHVEQLPFTAGTDRKGLSILVFDDHPDSLRLVFGRRTRTPAILRWRSWKPACLATLAGALLIAMFWPALSSFGGAGLTWRSRDLPPKGGAHVAPYVAIINPADAPWPGTRMVNML